MSKIKDVVFVADLRERKGNSLKKLSRKEFATFREAREYILKETQELRLKDIYYTTLCAAILFREKHGIGRDVVFTLECYTDGELTKNIREFVEDEVKRDA